MVSLLLIILIALIVAVLWKLRTVSHQMDEPQDEVNTAVLSEKVSQLEPVAQTVNDIQTNLAELQAHIQARHTQEQNTAESIKRLETVIAGTQTKGAAGENILEAVFSRLPAEWQERDFHVGNGTVGFGLRLPNNLVLPIDSKWAATNDVERLAISNDPDEQQRLKKQVESAVQKKASEVKKYIDPNITASFGIAVIPDAAYEVCGGLHADIFRQNVVIVSYSMLVPYLLLVFQTTLKTTQNIDLHRLNSYLKSVEEGIGELQNELDGRFSRATTMLDNSRRDMAGNLSNINAGLTSLRLSAGANGAKGGELREGDPE